MHACDNIVTVNCGLHFDRHELLDIRSRSQNNLHNEQGKGNVELYSASSLTPLTHSDMVHTVVPANHTMSAFIRKHFPGVATTHIRIANA